MKKLSTKKLILVLAAALVAASASGMALDIGQSAWPELEPGGLVQRGGLDIEPNGLTR